MGSSTLKNAYIDPSMGWQLKPGSASSAEHSCVARRLRLDRMASRSASVEQM